MIMDKDNKLWKGLLATLTSCFLCWKARFRITLASRANAALSLGPGPFFPTCGRDHETCQADSPCVSETALAGSGYCVPMASHLEVEAELGR